MPDRPNPYAITLDKVQEPPTSLWGTVSHLGPGFILSASIVGSGELIATTILGATAGFITLWVVIVSCLVKVTLQLEFGKHAIVSGESTFASFNRLPGFRIGRANWSIWTWFIIMIVKFMQVGGIVGLVGIAMHMVAPFPFETENPAPSVAVWCLIAAALVAILVSRGYYRLIERLSLIMIGLFTLLTLASVVMLQGTAFAVTPAEIFGGLTFQLPANTVIIIAAIGAFGITGVGGDEIMTYNYWLLEKGYAAKTGPRDASDPKGWNRRARGWIRVMYWDAILSMVVYTVVTAAFYVLGAAILHKQGLVPASNELLETLSRMYTDTLGPWARNLFLGGAVVVLFSTLFAALAGWTRLYSDCFAEMGAFDFQDPKRRRQVIAILAWVIPFLWALLYFFMKAPGMMVLLGGVGTAMILLIVVFAAMQFRYRRLPEELRPGRIYDAMLWISAVVIVASGVYGAVMLLIQWFSGKLG